MSRFVRDSRRTSPGDTFVACGEPAEVAAHAAEALARGAAAVWSEEALDGAVRVGDARWAFAQASARASGAAALRAPLLATTGTKGKTSTTQAAWWCLGGPATGAARIGTTGWHDGTTERPNRQTTPPPEELHAFLAALSPDCPGVALELSSHGADQHRLAGFALAGLAMTGMGHDHLDYHGSQAGYVAAKLRCCALLAPGALLVVNALDPHADAFAHAARGRGAQVVALGLGRRPHTPPRGARFAVAHRDGAGWRLVLDGIDHPLPVRLPGEFNAWNAAAGALLAHAAGVPLPTALARLADLPGAPGRMELLAGSPATYVDYAHTPESLAAAIAAVRESHPHARVAVVFGCGGDRDPSKRAPMGAAAAHADLVVLTDDNPRSEDPAAITAHILAGLPAGATAQVVHDRAAAITAARTAVGCDGVVLVAGKGHETEQVIGDRRLPWDDRAFVRGLGSAA